jgi:anaerobic magnesium-protoporphyrin IX monomethyl ester cyclase
MDPNPAIPQRFPSLTAFLTANGCQVEQDDINVKFYDDLLSRKSLNNYYERSFSKFQELESQNVLSSLLQKQYVNLSTSILLGDYVIEQVEAAKEVLRNKDDFFDIEKLFKAFKMLELGLKLASSAYLPSNLTFHAYDMSYSCRSSRDVLSAINDREQNLFIDYFEKNTDSRDTQKQPGPSRYINNQYKPVDPGINACEFDKESR